jgi:hypothetical protein
VTWFSNGVADIVYPYRSRANQSKHRNPVVEIAYTIGVMLGVDVKGGVR